MDKYLIDYSTTSTFNAGAKARVDINNILAAQGYQSIYARPISGKDGITLPYRVLNRLVRTLHLSGLVDRAQLRKAMKDIPNGSLLLMQYPFYPTYANDDVMQEIHDFTASRHCRFVVLIHDINSLRDQREVHAVRTEMRLLDLADAIIVHNSAMKAAVLEADASLQEKIYELELFDYRVLESSHGDRPDFARTVIIAGNLTREKSPYVYALPQLQLQRTEFDLYGVHYDGPETDRIRYQGVFASDNIPFHAGFGLVWDGDSIDNCTGHTGEYTKINNPHKLSLYMAAGIPVIVWRQAAVARFVEENQVGLCVDSLQEIDDRIGGMTEEEYIELGQNVTVMSERVRSGYYIRRVMDEIERNVRAV